MQKFSNAFVEGQQAGMQGASAGLNPNELGTAAYSEWERGRFAAEGALLALQVIRNQLKKSCQK